MKARNPSEEGGSSEIVGRLNNRSLGGSSNKTNPLIS